MKGEGEHREQEEAASDWFLSWLYPTLSAISAIVRTRRGLRRRQRQRRRLHAVKRRRRAPRRRPPIGGCRPQWAALITRPCSTVSLYCTRLESTLPCIGASDICIHPTQHICICTHIHIYTYMRATCDCIELYTESIRILRICTYI